MIIGKGFNPIPDVIKFTEPLARVLVNGSTKLLQVLTNTTVTTPSFNTCLISVFLRLIRLDLLFYTLFNALDILASLLQCNAIASIGHGHRFISNNKSRNYFASLHVEAKVMNLPSMVEWVIIVCFFEIQEMASPPSIKIHPLVGFWSPILVIQVASVYASKIFKKLL